MEQARGVKFQRVLRKDTAFDRLEERSFSVIIFQSRAFVILPKSFFRI